MSRAGTPVKLRRLIVLATLITAAARLGRIVGGHPMTAEHVRLIRTFE
jgi:hypothetical protein